jgi:hypothetical protein
VKSVILFSRRINPPPLILSPARRGGARAGAAMDEDSLGLFGLLLIVTALAVCQSMPKHLVMPTLPDVPWDNVLSVIGCGQSDSDACYTSMSQ